MRVNNRLMFIDLKLTYHINVLKCVQWCNPRQCTVYEHVKQLNASSVFHAQHTHMNTCIHINSHCRTNRSVGLMQGKCWYNCLRTAFNEPVDILHNYTKASDAVWLSLYKLGGECCLFSFFFFYNKKFTTVTTLAFRNVKAVKCGWSTACKHVLCYNNTQILLAFSR